MSQRQTKYDRRPSQVRGAIVHVVLGAALLAAGCVNERKEVQSYRAVLDGPSATQPSTRPATTMPTTLPATLSLEQALQIANAHNDQLMISGEDYVQALIAKARAEGTFLPSISFQPSFIQQKPFAYPAVGPGTSSSVFSQFAPQHATDLPINTNLSTSLVRDIYEVSRASNSIEQRRALLLDLQSTIFLNVARSYYDILEAEQSVETLSSSVRVQEERVANVSRRAEQGVARRLDVLQSQADAAATRVELTDARNRVASSRATLGFLLGRDPISIPLIDHFVPSAKINDEAALLRTARASRQDLVAAIADVRASAAAVKSAWGEYYPSIGINLNTFLYRESFPQDSWWTAIFTINLPLFEEGVIHQNVRAAYSRLRQAATRVSQTEHQIASDVHSAYADYEASVQRLVDLQTEVDASRRAYEAAVHAFDVGTATNLDVLTAQNSQLNSELRYDNERYNLKVTYLAVLRLTGKLDRAAIAQIAGVPHAAATDPTTNPTTNRVAR